MQVIEVINFSKINKILNNHKVQIVIMSMWTGKSLKTSVTENSFVCNVGYKAVTNLNKCMYDKSNDKLKKAIERFKKPSLI
jgi:hypothetical protein